MRLKPTAFAIPGDVTQKTGGYIYERELLKALRAAGRDVEHLHLPEGFPDATAAEAEAAIAAMIAVPPAVPLIIDGRVFGSLPTEALAKIRAPIIALIHHPLSLETGLSPERAQQLRERETANLQLARRVIVPSPSTAHILVEQFGVPADRIATALPGFRTADAIHTPLTPPLILSVGQLVERKGHDILVAALGQLRDLDWQAQIVGDTNDAAIETALRQQIADLDLGDRVTLAGLLSDDELIERYRSASIFALATRYEGYGAVLGEALLHGLPIVSCDTGAVPDTVPHGAGILVPVDDVQAFADALRRLLTDHSLRSDLAWRSAEVGLELPHWTATADLVGLVLDDEALTSARRD